MDDASLVRHAREVYTSSSFCMFEHEYKKSRILYVDVVSEVFNERGLVFVYKVQKIGHYNRHHTVTTVPCDGIVNCSCKYFDSSGILCSHALIVLRCLCIEKIPDRYVLARRTRNESGGSMEESCSPKVNHKQNQSSSPDCFHQTWLTGTTSDNTKGPEYGKDTDADHVYAPLLRHARDIYMSNIFYMFQEEYKKSEYYVARIVDGTCDHKGIIVEFEVIQVEHYPNFYKVHAEPKDGTVNCSCKKFENAGILCSHALSILDFLCIVSIPAQYILERFTKNAMVCSVEEIHGQEYFELEGFIRYKILHTRIDRQVKMAAKSEEALHLLDRHIDELGALLEDNSREQIIACERVKARDMNVVGGTSAIQEKGIKKRMGLHGGRTINNCTDKELKTERDQLVTLFGVRLRITPSPTCHATQPSNEFSDSSCSNMEAIDHKKN